MKRINNAAVRGYVQRREEFENNTRSLYGHMVAVPPRSTKRYVVCSYGGHHPLFIYEWLLDSPNDGAWFENIDKYSLTTSGHKALARPHTACTPMTTAQMKLIADHGLMFMMQALSKF
jgi:hypothetical protein